MEPNTEDKLNETTGLVDKIKKFKNDHKILFWCIVATLIILIVAVVVVIIIYSNKNKTEEKENYSSSNDISSEFDYVNSYIYSTLGEDKESV